MPINRHDPNYLILIGKGVPRDLLELAIEKNTNLQLLIQLYSKIELSIYYCWQLLILGKGDLMYQELPSNFWKEQDIHGGTPIHYGCWAGNVGLLYWIQTNYFELLTKKTHEGLTIAHYAARSGSTQMLLWVQDHYPELLTGKTFKDETIAHCAVFSGNLEALVWVHTNYPELLTNKTNMGSTIGHYAVQFGNCSMLCYLLKELPELTKKIWVPDHKGRMPQANLNFSHALRDVINSFFKDEEITRPQLIQLIDLVDISVLSDGVKSSSSDFLHMLSVFCSSCEQDTFNPIDRPHEVRCLQVLIEDYRQGLLGPKSLMKDLLVKTIVNSKTLEAFKPKPPSTEVLDIRPDNAMDYFEIFKERVLVLPLKSDEARAMRGVILPGVAHLIQYEDKIVTHVLKRYGVLYYLDGEKRDLPLHTDHTPIFDGAAYRATLNRLVANFFGAADIAYRAGRLSDFCGKITSGICFEGRVRDAFIWASSLSELSSFDTLMAQYIDEYQAYTKVIYHQDPVQSAFVEAASDFIIARYNEKHCLPNPIYAPDMKITKTGVVNYLEEVLCYSRISHLLEIETLLRVLKREIPGFFAQKALKEIKIIALTELKQQLAAGQPTIEAVRKIRAAYPDAIKGFHSRVKTLFNKLDPETIAENWFIKECVPQKSP